LGISGNLLIYRVILCIGAIRKDLSKTVFLKVESILGFGLDLLIFSLSSYLEIILF
jgi:hypothetical protein